MSDKKVYPAWHPASEEAKTRLAAEAKPRCVFTVSGTRETHPKFPDEDGVARRDVVCVDGWHHGDSGEIYLKFRVPLKDWFEEDGTTPIWRNKHVCDIYAKGVFGVSEVRDMVEALSNMLDDIEGRANDV